ncbi:hypothetical protein FOA43_000613 [Brettanomyces nanus]|uniref:High-affinity methionine permease n=1 Tax=Eeniella nana TaxID=13502 RepID=A0A875RXM2_EENNA|nr:uncharacterized protein FOA43_000613 [Brettanomyces nanus]QPG73303.1 hypothetical protein FOA43_000613 [Brettanomyces nanus]
MTESAIWKGTKQFFGAVILGIDHQPEVDDAEIEKFGDSEQLDEGAPVEKKSPLGYNVSHLTACYLIIQGVIGTGIFATPATILKSIGSVGASYLLWCVGFIVNLFIVFMYVEYVTYFRRRSGAQVVYLEQAYPNPKFMVPVMYAAVSVTLSYITSSASSFAQYVFKGANYDATSWQQRGLSVVPLLLAASLVALNTKWCMRLNNLIGFSKVIFILFVSFSGFAALAGSTKAPKDHSIFHNAWEGTTRDGNDISNALLKVIFSFGGTPYAFGVVAETHPKNTIRTYKYFVPFTLFLIFILYILCVTAYYAGIGNKEEITKTGNLVAAVYFQKIFGNESAVRAMCAFVALSSFGHLLTAFIAHSRVLRECGRQGVLPYPRIWASVKPFNTPIFPIFVTVCVNLVVLLAPPPGDAYNFVVDLGSYADYIFNVLLAIGLFRVRRDRKRRGLGYREFHIPTILLLIVLLWSLFVLAMAFVPPKGTLIGSDVSFFYATYPITTFGIFGLCVVYYFFWAWIIPRARGYKHRVVTYDLPNGERGHKVLNVPREELEEWDREHSSSANGLNSIGYDDEVTGSLETSVYKVNTTNSNNSSKKSVPAAEKTEDHQ